jgi:hypothetical protein
LKVGNGRVQNNSVNISICATSYLLMQQNATGPGQPAGVHFPEQLPGADIPRPPSTRPLPRVGSHNKDPSIPWPPNHSNDGYERARTSSIGSSFRSEGIGLGRPSRSPAHGPSPLNPTRRGSGQHIHRTRDSSETVDASKYDFDNAFGPVEAAADCEYRLHGRYFSTHDEISSFRYTISVNNHI